MPLLRKSQKTFYKEVTLVDREGREKKYGGKKTWALNIMETKDEVVIREKPFLRKERITIVDKSSLRPRCEIDMAKVDGYNTRSLKKRNGVVKAIKTDIKNGKIKYGQKSRISVMDAVEKANKMLSEAREKVIIANEQLEINPRSYSNKRSIKEAKEYERIVQEDLIRLEKEIMSKSLCHKDPPVLKSYCSFCDSVKKRLFS